MTNAPKRGDLHGAQAQSIAEAYSRAARNYRALVLRTFEATSAPSRDPGRSSNLDPGYGAFRRGLASLRAQELLRREVRARNSSSPPVLQGQVQTDVKRGSSEETAASPPTTPSET